MRITYASAALSAGLALGVTFVAAARAEPGALPAEQVQVADATLKLEKAFDDQFVRGTIDPEALSGPIQDVLQAMPEAARPKVQAHIAQILQGGARLASEMTPSERTQATASPALETLGRTRLAQIAAWGWPGAVGFGGLGAFGFPAAFGFGGGYSCSSQFQSVNGIGWGGGGCVPYGLGAGGWFY
jgi:hypothetical protein